MQDDVVVKGGAMFEKWSKALLLSPHTDDIELGAGGAIIRLIENHIEVFCLIFSRAEESVPDTFEKNILSVECCQALNILGVTKENINILKYPVRRFNSYRQEILEIMIKIRHEFDPDLVFGPSLDDIHQDHVVIAEESFRAFKKRSILTYELPWNNMVFKNACYISLSEGQLNQKIKALSAYKSQAHRDYMTEDFIKSISRVRGVQAGFKFAEVFEVVRWIIH